MSNPGEAIIPAMSADELYREDTYTDHKIGSIRVLTPITAEGAVDPGRPVLYMGHTQLMTAVGALPLNFDIDAGSLTDAVEKFSDAANAAVEATMKELQDMRREAASSLIVPETGMGGMGGPGGMPGGGKIQMP